MVELAYRAGIVVNLQNRREDLREMKKIPVNQYNDQLSYKSSLSLLLIFSAAALLLLSIYHSGQASPAAVETAYLPLATSSSRSAPPPVYASSIKLEDARCPNDIAINQISGDIYITNEVSNNVSLLHGTDFIGNIFTGSWPIWVESDPYSETVYVSNVMSGVSVLRGAEIKNQIPPYHESYNITINSTNGYTYVTDLHHPITIIKGEEKITDLFVPKFEGHQIEWQLASDYDQETGLTYFASWQKGAMTVVDGLEVVDQFPYYGEGAKDMVIDSYRRLMYVANFRAGEDSEWLNNVSVVDLDTKSVIAIFSSKHSRHLALDPTTGYVYATNPANDSVTVLRGTQAIATYPVGKVPWGVTVDPTTGYAYVANSGENSVSVFHDGTPVTKIELPQGEGFQPWQIAVDSQSHRAYVVNRSSKEQRSETALNRLICREPWVHILQ